MTYAEGEQVESLYYKSVVDGGEVFYEIQPLDLRELITVDSTSNRDGDHKQNTSQKQKSFL